MSGLGAGRDGGLSFHDITLPRGPTRGFGRMTLYGAPLRRTVMTSKDPLHGVTLEAILTRLAAELGWEAMGKAVRIRCFTHEPSIKSSLTFLRKNPWAREKVEKMYLRLEPKTTK